LEAEFFGTDLSIFIWQIIIVSILIARSWMQMVNRGMPQSRHAKTHGVVTLNAAKRQFRCYALAFCTKLRMRSS
jgi:hypothetical protein